MRSAAAIAGLFALFAAVAAAEAPATIFYDEASRWVPYVYPADAPQRGAVPEAVRLVFDMAGTPLRARYVSRLRAQRAFDVGAADVAVSALSWDRGSPEGVLLSAALMRTSTRLFFGDGVAFSHIGCTGLIGRPIWGVFGAVHPCNGVSEQRRMSGERGLVLRLARGDIFVAMMDYDAGRYWGRRLGVGVNIGPIVETADIRLKVRPKERELMRRLNVAIFEAVRFGRIDEIRRRYLVDAGLQADPLAVERLVAD